MVLLCFVDAISEKNIRPVDKKCKQWKFTVIRGSIVGASLTD